MKQFCTVLSNPAESMTVEKPSVDPFSTRSTVEPFSTRSTVDPFSDTTRSTVEPFSTRSTVISNFVMRCEERGMVIVMVREDLSLPVKDNP